MDLRRDQIKKLEDSARKITNFIKKHPDLATGDDEGNVINQYMYDHKTPKNNSQMRPFTEKVKFNEWVNLSFDSLINEADTTITAGLYNAPLEIGYYNWNKTELNPFNEFVDTEYNNKSLMNKLKNNLNELEIKLDAANDLISKLADSKVSKKKLTK